MIGPEPWNSEFRNNSCVCYVVLQTWHWDYMANTISDFPGWAAFFNFEAEPALDVPRPPFRTSFLIAHIHWLTIGQCESPLSTWVGCWLQIDAVFSPVFEDCLSEHASDDGREESSLQHSNSQVILFVELPLPRHFSTRPWRSAGSPCEPNLPMYSVMET